jgi:hypothetical protein
VNVEIKHIEKDTQIEPNQEIDIGSIEMDDIEARLEEFVFSASKESLLPRTIVKVEFYQEPFLRSRIYYMVVYQLDRERKKWIFLYQEALTSMKYLRGDCVHW